MQPFLISFIICNNLFAADYVGLIALVLMLVSYFLFNIKGIWGSVKVMPLLFMGFSVIGFLPFFISDHDVTTWWPQWFVCSYLKNYWITISVSISNYDNLDNKYKYDLLDNHCKEGNSSSCTLGLRGFPFPFVLLTGFSPIFLAVDPFLCIPLPFSSYYYDDELSIALRTNTSGGWLSEYLVLPSAVLFLAC